MKVSVCIPAYKNPAFLQRALQSLVLQQFSNWELIITDDSPDDSVQAVVQEYNDRLPIRYFKNTPAHGMPANWNTAYDKATGEYIKILHDDDWLETPLALQKMADALDAHPDCDFVFSAYRNQFLATGRTQDVHCSAFHQKLLQEDPVNLFQTNFIGPPSVIMHRNRPPYRYDLRTRWVVDIDFYMEVLRNNPRFVYIDEILVNVGIGEEQITQDCFRNREVEIPENYYLLQKRGVKALNNIYVYDFFWRNLRNLEIRSAADLQVSRLAVPIPPTVLQMVRRQRWLPLPVLRMGVVSKIYMTLSYFFRKRA
ncbi:Glycosyltransferase involved in cell wall bisynthesis [Chitinophaga costaii]|uniref:Glycosyltransferase involved in cell wall bisynthesis n=1 Tax=Chitinophaga costaii TaxID=1335309 RepID=A0A1C4ECK1_9BACT|nr:glycosyltransferase family 2 protein [Chitinophaga costaii]SCC41349.1 Glycosyltransferase involved in cell wall bisynthesis [Chitinophaga costaii]